MIKIITYSKTNFKQQTIKLFTVALFLFFIASCKDASYQELTQYVDPFIGTDGHGHTFPGATVPFGMVQISPDTRMENWDGSSGYHYSDKTIMGFSQTHLSGTGAPEYCDILLMPTVGRVQMLVGDENDSKTGYRSSYNHDNEYASPGYYSVLLDDYDVKVELTSTARSGFHQYTFPASNNSNIIIDLQNRDRVINSEIHIVNDNEISGYRRSTRWVKDQHVYFYAKFSKPFKSFGIAINDTLVDNITNAEGENIKAFISYDTNQNEKVLVKIGVSAVSIENAKMNLDEEIKSWDFDKIKNEANNTWNKHLSKIELEGGTEKQRRIFYTSFYHTAIVPNLFNDVDGSYRGVDLKVHNTNGFTRYTLFSLWDVFRAQMPLYTILEPSRMNDFIRSFLAAYEHMGRLPHWEIWGTHSGSMIGHHSLPVILDAFTKGIRNYDIDLAYKAMKNQVDKNGYYSRMGYIPADKGTGSVSIVMEYSYNDWCVAEMAKLLGKDEDHFIYQQRAQFYKNLYDSSTGFMSPKNTERNWVEHFDPAEGSEHFVEGNSYQYSLFAPHDVSELIKLIGGDKEFENWLDKLFTTKSKHDENVIDASGLIGQYAHGNEPSHHMAYLYNYVGAAPKSQKIVNQILSTLYNDTPEGLEGNEDCGQMSAWYILSSIGFYPVNPGDTKYIIGAPLFDKVTINLENLPAGQAGGKQFIIEADGVSDENIYIQSCTLNGKPYTKSWFTHDEIVNGGKFVFTMGSTPNYNWGSSNEDRPSTPKLQPTVSMPYIVNLKNEFLNSTKIILGCDTDSAQIYYTLNGSEPTEKSNYYIKPIKVDRTTIVKFKAIKEGLLSSLTVTETLNKLEYEKFTNYDDTLLQPGLKFKYYEANVMFVKELAVYKPKETGVISHFTIEDRRTDFEFGYEYKGYINVPKDGAYTFYNKTNDGSIFYLDGKEFINMDGGHPAYEASKTIALKKGIYKIGQKYFQMAGGFLNKVSWKGPGFKKMEIPSSKLFHQK
ncbi:MAG: GH92 family glycosyl hydrolase [Bacteroidota bacterium]